jgi:hypothetical protein
LIDSEGLNFYKDYTNKQANKTGLVEDDLKTVFTYDLSKSFVELGLPTDESNLIEHKGQNINVATLSNNQRINLEYELPFDKVQKYKSLEYIKSLYHASTITRKLY